MPGKEPKQGWREEGSILRWWGSFLPTTYTVCYEPPFQRDLVLPLGEDHGPFKTCSLSYILCGPSLSDAGE